MDQAENPLSNLPLEITVSVGHARPSIREVLDLSKGVILSLDRSVNDPVELYIGDRLFARGELQELDGDQKGQLGVCLTEVIDLRKNSL
ncbi:FliM/FliN family flagellar motor switch protein [Actibacterium sp. XHP0104]|uniref:FliM/FliN family flagellar motor switch protein n=1 Tax=Actibacterium sp. XHP0104 TaxID=2984335 RepID=UPI001411CD55|nr:FliM/FliN family flagellar motor C-terminal domain-containing protein [Actibacterium sp. XHP0104]MCV2881820.1 FliM/FliN family flagellar motor C-terminal domain-containing protein [Actibacterium sp. XHP0104]NHX27319.1 FliM/FliN family flagellar motor switch protein [Escherichia coli]